MSVYAASGVTKYYGANLVFADLQLRIEQSDRIGLVGPNGAGKSSLLRILAGELDRDGGVLHVARGTRVGYLPQDPPPAGDRTLFADLRDVFSALLARGEELRQMEAQMTAGSNATTTDADLEQLLIDYGRKQEAFERAGGYTIEQRIATVLSGLGLDEALWHEPLTHLSGGQRTRALLGRLLLEEPDLLLLDEPTNHLDVRSVEWLEERLLQWKGALLVVSHDRFFLDRVTNRIWELAHNRLETYRGNYSHYKTQRADRLHQWRTEYEKQQQYIQETRDFIRRYKAGQRAKEARGRETRLERFIQDEALPPPPSDDRIRLPLRAGSRSGDLVLRTRNLVVGYPATGADNGHTGAAIPILRVPDLEIRRGDTVALIGPNGSGKTTLVRTLLEELVPVRGGFQLGAGVEPGYLAQRHMGAGFGLMDGEQSVLDALLEIQNLPLARARNYLAQFLFRGDDVFKRINLLSGGQRSRIALARLTLLGANFLLLDEPTNHLDLDSQEILQDALQQFEGTILLITHDRALVNALATQIWDVIPSKADGADEPNLLDVFRGSWQQWQRERLGATAPDEPAEDDADAGGAQLAWEEQRAERRRRQEAAKHAEQIAAVEQEVSRLEGVLQDLEKRMAVASQKQDFDGLQAITGQHQDVGRQIEAEMERWAALSESQESALPTNPA